MSGDCDCACAAAPDVAPIANASKESAEIMAQLGREQMAESRRQYDSNKAVADQVVNAQLGVMNDTNAQAKDYYEYGKTTFRPIEQKIADIATRGYDPYSGTDEASLGVQREAEAAGARAKADINRQTGIAQQTNARQMAAMGVNPNSGKFGSANRMSGLSAATAIAGAQNNARTQAKTTQYARMMDAAGIGRNLPGASQGAYSLAVGAGSAANQNNMAPGNALMSGIGQGAATTGSGYQMQLGGLGSALNAQTSYANSMNAAMNSGGGGGGMMGGLGGLMGGVASMWSAFSDRRLKSDIRPVGEENGFRLYAFRYIADPDREWVGVMADEVEAVRPDAVFSTNDGYKMVDYGRLGIAFRSADDFAQVQ